MVSSHQLSVAWSSALTFMAIATTCSLLPFLCLMTFPTSSARWQKWEWEMGRGLVAWKSRNYRHSCAALIHPDTAYTEMEWEVYFNWAKYLSFKKCFLEHKNWSYHKMCRSLLDFLSLADKHWAFLLQRDNDWFNFLFRYIYSSKGTIVSCFFFQRSQILLLVFTHAISVCLRCDLSHAI